MILGIDTSYGISVGVVNAGVTLARRMLADTRSHAEQLAVLIGEALAEAGIGMADISGVVVGMGPGPFTGLRVGIVTAETIAFANGVPVKHVSSLDAIALASRPSAPDAGDFIAATDARRKELYWGVYHSDGTPVGAPQVGEPGKLPALPVVGPGAVIYPDAGAGLAGWIDLKTSDVVAPGVSEAEYAVLGVDAAFLAAHTDQLAEVGPEPLYLRLPDAQLPTVRKSALSGKTLRIGKLNRGEK